MNASRLFALSSLTEVHSRRSKINFSFNARVQHFSVDDDYFDRIKLKLKDEKKK